VAVDAWLPVGFKLPDGTRFRRTMFEGAAWQIVETEGDGRALIAEADLTHRWTEFGLLDTGVFHRFAFGDRKFAALTSGTNHMLCPVFDSRSPNTKNEALAFALALRATREIDKDSPLQDAVYVEKYSRLLPTHSISSRIDDDVVLGYWLTGGATVSVKSARRIRQMLSWMSTAQLAEVLTAAGLDTVDAEVNQGETLPKQGAKRSAKDQQAAASGAGQRDGTFRLPGRPDLETFFNEHIVDIVTHRDRYKALGIDFPSAVVLHGPPGCGKTFAVERLVDFLGWPSFQIEASSVASPYIHETSRKVAEVFDKAMKSAPSVLIIDEMDAFLADRQMGSGHHRVEEVAEFLRRIPEATRNEVLVVAMTNRLELIDPAILRRGRFDHVISVGYASSEEIRSLLDKLLADIPKADDVDSAPLATALAGRPLSDVAFVIREGARLAARDGRGQLDQENLMAAMKSAAARHQEESPTRRIGFF
jgi:cell division protease FtsH